MAPEIVSGSIWLDAPVVRGMWKRRVPEANAVSKGCPARNLAKKFSRRPNYLVDVKRKHIALASRPILIEFPRVWIFPLVKR